MTNILWHGKYHQISSIWGMGRYLTTYNITYIRIFLMLSFLTKFHPWTKECWKGVDIMIQQWVLKQGQHYVLNSACQKGANWNIKKWIWKTCQQTLIPNVGSFLLNIVHLS